MKSYRFTQFSTLALLAFVTFGFAGVSHVQAEQIVSFSLDTNPGWSMEGVWEFGVPLGYSSYCYDATSGYTGSNVYGCNLAGDCPTSMPPYHLTTTTINCSGYEDVTLNFWRWLSVFGYAMVEVSNNGSDWTTLWNNSDYYFCDGEWVQCTYDISAVADNQPTVYIRWTMGPTDSVYPCSGWNIDDISLSGMLSDDLIVTSGGLGSNGYEGGPFEPSAKNYTLSNTGAAALDWTAAEAIDMPWLDVVPNSGTLGPGQSVVVSVSINANANSLAIGSYGTDIIFTNLTSGRNHVRTVNLAVRQTPPDGWASMNGGTTGGAGGTVVTVTTAADLKTYTEANEPYIIQVSGTIDLISIPDRCVYIKSDKTIRGIDTRPTIIGKLTFAGSSSNIIIEKLNITNPYAGDPYDGISVKPWATNIFITRCSVYNCGDGGIDITEQSDFVTVSWCKFYYDTRAGDDGHRFVNLIGANDYINFTDPPDRGKLRVTMHHNWWSTLCHERMPRVRYGQVHVYNNYYGCSGNNYCIGVGIESHIRVENNYFNNVDDPWEDYSQDANATHPAGEIGWNTGNVFYNTQIPTWAVNNYATIFTPPYPYGLDNGSDVKAIVMSGAGAPACYGDFISLGIVNKEDLEYFLEKYWLVSNSNQIAEADYYADGIVNFREFALFAENWMYTPPDIVPPAVPTGLVATAGDSTVSLDWDNNNNSEPDFDGYNVYRSETGDNDYTKLNGSLLTDSNYTDNNVMNETAYFYAVTAVDTSANESAYSNKVWAIPLGEGSIIIQEYASGFCGTDGQVKVTYIGFTGLGYCATPANANGYGIDWSISVPSDGTYTFVWRYSLSSGNRTARLLINDSEVVASISFPATGAGTKWTQLSQEVGLLTGTNHIRLEAITTSGLANIDYIIIAGDNPVPASCP